MARVILSSLQLWRRSVWGRRLHCLSLAAVAMHRLYLTSAQQALSQPKRSAKLTLLVSPLSMLIPLYKTEDRAQRLQTKYVEIVELPAEGLG